jgi:hypothetical protein
MAYFHEPYWSERQGDVFKTLLLFFEGIAITVPDYMRDRPLLTDPTLAQPLDDQGLLVRLSPEKLISQPAAESLAELLVEMLAADAFGSIETEGSAYTELSSSRLGSVADPALFAFILEELVARNLARRSEDGVSIPMHPTVRAFVLLTLPQLLREPAEQDGYALHPISSHSRPVRGLLELLDLNPLPTAGRVVACDLEQVTLDVSSIPLDEVLDFRERHGEAHRRYMRNLRAFVRDLAVLDEASRGEALLDRREELADAADDLRRAARKAWRKPLPSFGLGIAGSAVALAVGNPIGAGISVAQAILGLNRESDPGSAYSYVFQAREQLSRR